MIEKNCQWYEQKRKKMSKINISGYYSTKITQTDTNELFARPVKPYSWVFYVKGANACVGACFCCSPLKECPVLQCALRDKNLSTDLGISKSEVTFNDNVNFVHYLHFYFTPTVNPSALQQKLTHIHNRIPWDNTKQSNKQIKSR